MVSRQQVTRPLLLALAGFALSALTREALQRSGTFVLPSPPGSEQVDGSARTISARTAVAALRPSGGAGTGSYAVTAALGSAALALGLAALRGATRQPQVARQADTRYERKWWLVKEERDPTTLPVWQRDFRNGFQFLKRSMVEARKAGKKIFWDVRVINQKQRGVEVEMLKTGLIGVCPISQEGMPPGERLQVGAEVKMECLACPQSRLNMEKGNNNPWPKLEPHVGKVKPIFSHYMYLEQQRSIQKAQELQAGTIVNAKVFKHCPKGLVMELEGEGKPKGMLAMQDISRKMTPHPFVDKMFPPGTPMRVYVVHADQKNGRITLSTKEFEDDDHMGWMLSFPERCMARAEEGLRRYNEKRDAYIKHLQR